MILDAFLTLNFRNESTEVLQQKKFIFVFVSTASLNEFLQYVIL